MQRFLITMHLSNCDIKTKSTTKMHLSTRFFVKMIVSFLMINFICTSFSLTAEDKIPRKGAPAKETVKENPAKEIPVSVKEENVNDTTEVVRSEDIYILEDMLYVKTPLINDLIYIYTTSGLCIDKFIKETELIVKDASAYPKGVLTITNGKGLTVRVIK